MKLSSECVIVARKSKADRWRRRFGGKDRDVPLRRFIRWASGAFPQS